MESNIELDRFAHITIKNRPIFEGEKLVQISKSVNGDCMSPILKHRDRIQQEAIMSTSPKEADVGIIYLHDSGRRFGIWGPIDPNKNRMILSPNVGVGHGQIQPISEDRIQLMVVIGRLNDMDYKFLLKELRIM